MTRAFPSVLVSMLMAVSVLAACGKKQETPAPDGKAESAPATAVPASVSAEEMLAHIEVLASDAFEGRLPGSAGEKKTVAYLTEQFTALGLEPGNPDGSYVQKVPLVGIQGSPKMALRAGKSEIPMVYRDDFVAGTARFRPRIEVRGSPLVFVGYGVQAPELNWDDYKGREMAGKTLVMLINDPAVPDPNDPSRLDPAMFKGPAMTYYGRWTYKYEIAAALGAAGVLIVHETGPAGYPWEVVRNSWSGETFELANPDGNAGRVPVQGWITLDKAKALFVAAGRDFDALKLAAARADFQPVALDARLDITIDNQVREIDSHNVVALLPGASPERRDELLIYSSHWDHFGRDELLSDDPIFNGAVDNATGVAGILEIAKAFATGSPKPARSILFLAVTAEEQGLLGSRYYAEHPLYPLSSTLADINIDALNPWGPTREMQVIGHGQTTLEDDLARVLTAAGRVVEPDAEPAKGYYYRSDQFSFAKVGVPGLYADGGAEVIGTLAGWGQAKRDEYVAHDYHKPSDEVKPGWNLSGAAQDMTALYQVGLGVANGAQWPRWKDGSEFKAIREASLAAAP